MKYKGVELKSGDQYESELCVSVYGGEGADLEDEYEILETEFAGMKNVQVEQPLEELILVRCWDITFDQDGLDLLKSLYNMTKLNLDGHELEVEIDIHMDEWIEENGKSFNTDSCSYEEFLTHLEY